MSNLLKCDECGTEVDLNSALTASWIRLELPVAVAVWTGSYRNTDVDLCSVACLKAYVGKLKE